MPVLKHAKKKLRQDKKRTTDNLRIKETFKKLVKKAKAKPTPEAISAAFSSIDKAAKKQIIHKNKAARLKASISKVVSGSAPKEQVAKKATKSSKAATLKKNKKKTTKK